MTYDEEIVRGINSLSYLLNVKIDRVFAPIFKWQVDPYHVIENYTHAVRTRGIDKWSTLAEHIKDIIKVINKSDKFENSERGIRTTGGREWFRSRGYGDHFHLVAIQALVYKEDYDLFAWHSEIGYVPEEYIGLHVRDGAASGDFTND